MHRFASAYSLLRLSVISYGWSRILSTLLILFASPLAFSATCNSGGTGNWTAIAWSCGAVPTSDDDVFILNGHTVTINANSVARNVTVGGGASGTLRYSTTSGISLTVGNNTAGNGNVTVAANGTFEGQNSGTYTSTLALQGDLTNNGTIQFSRSTSRVVLVAFGCLACVGGNSANTLQTLGGTGTTSNFHDISIQKAAKADTVEVTLASINLTNAGFVRLFTATSGPFTQPAQGTLKWSLTCAAVCSDAIFDGTGATYTIGANAVFWLNAQGATPTNVTVTYQTGGTTANLVVNGQLRMTAGTLNIGNAANESLQMTGASSNITFEGGTTTIAGQLRSTTATDTGTYAMTGGTLNVGNVAPTGATFGPFFLGSNTTFNWSGGNIVLRRVNATGGAREFDVRSSSASVTNADGGGTLRVLAAAAGLTFEISHSAAASIWNLEVAATNNPAVTLFSNAVIRHTVTMAGTGTVNLGGFNVGIGSGNAVGSAWTKNGAGTFTGGAGTVTFTGSSAQTIDGTNATAFTNLAFNKTSAANTVTIDTTPTVSGTLTLQTGRVVTGTNRLDLTSTGTINAVTPPSSASYVYGTVRKNFDSGDTLNFVATAGVPEFPVGDATTYAPVEITNGTAGSASTLDVSTSTGPACGSTGTDHPQICTPIASTVINKADSVNRYWSLASGMTITGGTYAATFYYDAADRDTGNFANYTAQYCAPAAVPGTCTGNWFPGGNGTGSATNTTAPAIGGFGDFAVGVPLSSGTFSVTAVPGDFNAFETAAAAEVPTPANAIAGKIVTKVAGTAFSLDIASINAAKSGYGASMNTATTVDILQVISNDQGTCPMDTATACRTVSGTCWNLVQTITTTFQPNTTRATLANININNVYPEARIRVTRGALVGCSTDAFAVRPASITPLAADNDWQTAGSAPTTPSRTLSNTGASGGNVHKAGVAFSLLATPIANGAASASNYNGSPTVLAGSPTLVLPAAGTPGNLVLGTWNANATAGTRQSDTATYDNVGAIALLLEDATYANVDSVDGSSTTTRTIPQTGATAINVGRFVPAYFEASKNTPLLRTFGSNSACGRSFTYIGQPFWFATLPTLTLTAKNAAGTTLPYYGNASLFHLTGSMVSQVFSNNAIGPALDSSSIGGFNVTNNGDGTATVTATNAGTEQIFYVRNTSTPASTFTASISTNVTAADTSESAVSGNGSIATSTTPVVFDGSGSGMGFDNGAGFRYGRLRVSNALGTELLPLPVPMEAQYWNGTTFVTNSADNCTNLTSTNITLGSYQRSGADTWTTTVNLGSFAGPSSFSAGVANLRLTKPTGTITGKGSVNVTVDLAAESKTWLQGAWTGLTYTQNPTARATFGVYRGANEFIYIREQH